MKAGSYVAMMGIALMLFLQPGAVAKLPDPVQAATPTTHVAGLLANAIIADHNHTDISQVPPELRDSAKSSLKIWYGHTSHGSQITTGMVNLQSEYGATYNFNADGTGGALSYREVYGDLGVGGDLGWRDTTRSQLDRPDNDRNMVIWSWCGGVSTSTEPGIDIYLASMNQLEIDYPGVRFVYMTGHLDGGGEAGNLNLRNNQIRSYCSANNKILFDFADIESYDPDGNYFLDHNANDNCDYSGGNWAQQWCAAHPASELCAPCDCVHSQALNCNLKARAFWWMLAQVAGSALPAVTTNPATNITTNSATLNGTLTTDGGEACQYRFCRGTTPGVYTDNTTWSTDNKTIGQTFSANITGLVPGTKYYFIAQAKNSAGTGSGLEENFTTTSASGDNIGVWRANGGNWFVYPNFTPTQFGLSSDVPLAADYNNDGTTEFAVWRPNGGNWFVYPNFTPTQFGLSSDIAVPADYDNDGSVEYAVWRPGTGDWYVYPSFTPTQFGLNGDIPVPADYDNDGSAEYAVWRPSTGNWYVYPSFTPTQFGLNGDIPVPGDYDGDGTAEFAVWRPSTGDWYVYPSFTPTQFGLNGDVPWTILPSAYYVEYLP